MDEKGFNEEELSDIMKEIEALEDDFKEAGTKTAMTSPVVSELAQLETEAALPSKAAEKMPEHSDVIEFEKPITKVLKTPPTTMTFKVQGDLTMDLQFDVAGKVVRLEVNETGLNVCMDGGVTFSVPFEKSHKKTA